MNLAFQIEAHTNADGDQEIVELECEPTQEQAGTHLAAEPLAAGSWLFQFVMTDGFDGSEPLFDQFRRYGLDPDAVGAACAEAAHGRSG